MLNVIGTLVDPTDTGIAIEALHGKFGKIAVAAKRLDRFGANPFGGPDATSFAMQASISEGRPATVRAAACKTICRAVSMRVAIAAIRNPTA